MLPGNQRCCIKIKRSIRNLYVEGVDCVPSPIHICASTQLLLLELQLFLLLLASMPLPQLTITCRLKNQTHITGIREKIKT